MQMDISTVVFALVAIFVAWKLRSVLEPAARRSRRSIAARPAPRTRRRSAARSSPQAFADRRPNGDAAAARPLEGLRRAGLAGRRRLRRHRRRRSVLRSRQFPQRRADRLRDIVGAFAAADVPTLRRLLAPEVLANFDKAIRDRVAAEQTMTTTLVSIDSANVIEARLAGTVASVAVRFAAKLVVGDARQGGRVGRRLAQRRRRPSRRLDVHPRRRRARSQLAVGGDADRELRQAPNAMAAKSQARAPP